MGWRGALRSIQAAARQAEREAQRQARAAERARKTWQKEREQAAAAAAVEEQEEMLASLTGAHRDASPEWDWAEIAASAPPNPPEQTSVREAAARQALARYKPGWMARTLGFAHRRSIDLKAALEQAHRADAEENARAQSEYEARRRDWDELAELSAGILRREPRAYGKALDAYQEEICEDVHARSLVFEVYSSLSLVARVGVHPPEFLPPKRRTLLKTGRLSERAFPKRDFHKLYSDYVAAASIRVARELHALLPTPLVITEATCPLLDAASGHVREQVLLSIAVPRESLTAIAWSAADPTLCLAYFTHHSGLGKVGEIKPVVSLAPQPA